MSRGTIRNIGKDGRTYQKVASKWLAIRDVSPVSRQSHITPRIDTSGNEATSAATPGLRRAISEIAAIRRPDRMDFRTK